MLKTIYYGTTLKYANVRSEAGINALRRDVKNSDASQEKKSHFPFKLTTRLGHL